MNENNIANIDKINVLLQKIYSLRQTVLLQEQMDKHQDVIRPYNLVFSKLHHSLTDTLVIELASLYELKNDRNPKTLSIMILLQDLEELQVSKSYYQTIQLWKSKIDNSDIKKTIKQMRNKYGRGHLDEDIFKSAREKNVWKILLSFEELYGYLDQCEKALSFIAVCYELSFDYIKDNAISKQAPIDFAKQTISFFEKIKN